MSTLRAFLREELALTATEYGLVAGITILAVLLVSRAGPTLAGALDPDSPLGVAMRSRPAVSP